MYVKCSVLIWVPNLIGVLINDIQNLENVIANFLGDLQKI